MALKCCSVMYMERPIFQINTAPSTYDGLDIRMLSCCFTLSAAGIYPVCQCRTFCEIGIFDMAVYGCIDVISWNSVDFRP